MTFLLFKRNSVS